MKLASLFKSFVHAVHGIEYVFKHEQNFRIESAFGMVVIACAYFLGVTRIEFIILLFLIILILVLELLNSGLEALVDLLKPRLHTKIEFIKDVMAGVVLMAAFGALIIGIIIFYPYLIEQFS